MYFAQNVKVLEEQEAFEISLTLEARAADGIFFFFFISPWSFLPPPRAPLSP